VFKYGASLDYGEESAPVGQEFYPKSRLLKAMVGMVDKMEKIKNKNLKLDFLGCQVSRLRV
jgi:hypothetical protein